MHYEFHEARERRWESRGRLLSSDYWRILGDRVAIEYVRSDAETSRLANRSKTSFRWDDDKLHYEP